MTCGWRCGALSLSLAALACGLGLLAASAVPTSASVAARNGGTFNISLTPGGIDFLDPAKAYNPPSWAVLSATCAGLMRYPKKPPPAGLRIAPDVAAFPPRVSSDGKTYTFTLRQDFRFSDGKPVRAEAFARAISRMLIPEMKSPGAEYAKDIVGAEAVTAGTRTVPTGVTAKGTRLVIKSHGLLLTFLCARRCRSSALSRRACRLTQRARGLRGGGTVLRLRVHPWAAGRAEAESVLQRGAAAPRRSLHRRHAGGLTRPGARPDRTQPG